jgi:hypothetical protein
MTTFLKNIEITTNWINLGPLITRVMNFIGFNNFFFKLSLFNYMIKIDACKIEYQP